MVNNFKEVSNISLPESCVNKYASVDGLSLQNLYYSKMGTFPNCYLFDYEARTNGDYTFDTNKMVKYLVENISDDENVEVSVYHTKVLGSKNDKVRVGFCIILNKSHIYARFESRVCESYILYPNDKTTEFEKFLDMVLQFYVAPSGAENTYWRISSSPSGYYLEKGNIKCPSDFKVEKLYNDDFLKEHEKIEKFIEEPDKSGLVLLHGEKGTGKSTYIKYLINKFSDKKFVFVPSHLVTLLGDSSFGSFLTTLNNSILVLEDCENIITDRKVNAYSSAVSLLLNMTDGIMADDLGIKFICTFNDDMTNIDPALLRKGRCVSKYEFKPLCAEKAEVLLSERGIEAKINKAITLADIFHYEDDDYQVKRRGIV